LASCQVVDITTNSRVQKNLARINKKNEAVKDNQ